MSVDLQILNAMYGNLASNAARLAASALVAGLWQSVLLCAATGLILKVLPKSTATLRFVIWTTVFCVSVAMPFIALPGSMLAGSTEFVTASQITFDVRWSYLLVALWIAASAYRLFELVIQAIGLRALWKTAMPVSGDALPGLDVTLVAAGRKVEICTSDEVDRPSVIGFWAPRILIPTWLLGQLTAVELNHIVLHELEHLRRKDDWVNLLQKVGLVLLPLNPALFWIDRRLSTERELACDDGVLQQTKTPRAYAASLASIAERRLDVRLHPRPGMLALAATGLKRRRSELVQRIESILGRRSPVNRAISVGVAASLVLGILGLAGVLAHAPQLVSFSSGEPVQQALVRPTIREKTEVPVSLSPPSLPPAEAQNVSFHPSRKLKTGKHLPVIHNAVSEDVDRDITERRVDSHDQINRDPLRLVVLTSWGRPSVSQVVVQTPDGRFFLAPYAAVPTQAGWLLVQL